jgi:hypothetical protein
MSTMTREPKTVKPKKSAPVVSLALAIDHVVYQVEPIPAGEFGTKAFRLSKKSNAGEVYDVIRDNDGLVQCDCPSYEVTFRGTLGTCKHGSALVTLGLLDAPCYTRWPSPEDFDAPSEPATPAPDAPAPIKPIVATTPADRATALPGASDAITDDSWAAELAAMPKTCECGNCHTPISRLAFDGYGLCEPCYTGMFTTPTPVPCCAPEEATPCRACDGEGRIFDTDGLYPGTPEWSDCPDCSPVAPAALTLAELVDREAGNYRAWGTEAGDLIAGVLADLARKVRFTGAMTPVEFLDRADAADLVLALRA